MTVGAGTTSEHAHKLAAMLDQDSGYGGSIADSASSPGWSGHNEFHTTQHSHEGMSARAAEIESERRTVASHVHQLYYNHNRTALARAISRTMDALRKLQEFNIQWPAHYPSVQPPPAPKMQQDVRPSMHHTQSTFENHLQKVKKRPMGPMRAETSMGERSSQADGPESSASAANKPVSEPRLVTPQLAREFSVLKIDLKMDGLSQTEIIHSLRKDSKALAQLLDGQIGKSVRHLSALRERIEDTSSKVLVTGDLNAGKSTFCNALLRRKILPEDEQPCTSIFCEVLDVRENAGLEEVHAIHIDSDYNRNDERTYDVYPLKQLEHIVVDNDRYSQCKVYVKDIRSVDESLLNNGVLDIALIDAPGLNNDSLKTTAVFARQEEIDVVVFVVSAANHFTLSAKEFIYDAAREKAYIFMVVNGFDTIKNKQRCQEQILKQVAHLSPATFKESPELVHFVSSNAVPVAPLGGLGGIGMSNGNAGESFPFDEPDHESDNDEDVPGKKHGEPGETADKGKGKQRERIQDFEALEASLRRFVLEKRARSKLAPAKTYLTNVLGDLNSLAVVNRDIAQAELDRVSQELKELEPVLETSRKARNEAGEGVDRSTEESASNVYDHTREFLTKTISEVAQRDLGVPYEGFWAAPRFAEEIIAAMLQEITTTVGFCEDFARNRTEQGVNVIKSLGILHLGDSYINLDFHGDRMLRRKRDALARQVDINVDFWDYFDFVSLWDRQEKVVGSSMAVTVAGVVGTRVIGGAGWVDGVLGAAKVVGSNNFRRLLIPGLLAAGKLLHLRSLLHYRLTTFAVALGLSYAVASIPLSLPRRLSAKLAAQLGAIDFTHTNAVRISAEVRKALKIPADHLRSGLQKNLEQLQDRREETSKIRSDSEVARKYFGNLVRDSNEIRLGVERVDLEGPGPGALAAAEH